ncbi:PadR family transcriptional regulator [uncultured Dubosiella sp.]|uniref:PadR family transcriptional regulator n=1 Tax=uncultured Dubosiella sp. TaxID=1937011 RepID=UPI0027305FB8|nr:PadR family transcriptional regulator [uncultured Dubosiella sp.]
MRFPLPAPLLEFLILASLENEDSYGYEICQTIKSIQAIKEPVLYPILKKLQNENQIESYEKIIRNRRRKYYALTEAGRNELAAMRQDWQLYVDGIDKIVQPKGETHA